MLLNGEQIDLELQKLDEALERMRMRTTVRRGGGGAGGGGELGGVTPRGLVDSSPSKPGKSSRSKTSAGLNKGILMLAKPWR